MIKKERPRVRQWFTLHRWMKAFLTRGLFVWPTKRFTPGNSQCICTMPWCPINSSNEAFYLKRINRPHHVGSLLRPTSAARGPTGHHNGKRTGEESFIPSVISKKNMPLCLATNVTIGPCFAMPLQAAAPSLVKQRHTCIRSTRCATWQPLKFFLDWMRPEWKY